MKFHLREVQPEWSSESFMFGKQETGPRFGGAHRSGQLTLQESGPRGYHCRHVKCSTYRKAQRKLTQYLKGYNV